ncbi:unnamed protein product [Effrenium voratum]|nr:unnamed protein product [Effrenium voratum]
MLSCIRFEALLNTDGDPDCPWPTQDPYRRYGAEHFARDGAIIWFEPLPPMLPILDSNPKLPPSKMPDAFSLVLDLDETLVHYSEHDGMGSYEIRPGMQEFVQRMHQNGYELIIFTAATQELTLCVLRMPLSKFCGLPVSVSFSMTSARAFALAQTIELECSACLRDCF